MANLGAWLETDPADSSGASRGDDALRSLMTQVATGIGGFAYWPGSAASLGRSAASIGETMPGSLRFYSAVDMGKGSANNGFLALTSVVLGVGRASVWHAGTSGTTGLLAHSAMVEHLPQPPIGTRWLCQKDSASVAVGASVPQATLTQVFNFATPYNGRPFIFVTIDHSAGAGQYALGFTSATGNGFTSVMSRLKAAGASPITVRYLSIGTVSL